jgi:N-acetylglucosamine-6-phosphate deacetylase
MANILAGLQSVRTHLDRPPAFGARCLGVHLEGPLSVRRPWARSDPTRFSRPTQQCSPTSSMPAVATYG